MTDLTETQLDRARCAALFGVDEGDLGDEPFDGHAYWYEGVPEWAEGHFSRDERHSPSGRYRTLIVACVDDKPTVPEGWRLVRLYHSASERDCAWCGTGTGNEASRSTCRLCEGDGLLYWGEEWCEIVIEQPLLEEPGPEEGLFLGSTQWRADSADIVELWTCLVDGDRHYSAVWSEDWPGELTVSERLLRHHPELRIALSWVVIAEERYKAQQERE